ncbi:MAG: tryptophan synthase subunit alpha [Myxococcota bacterium]
MITDALRAPKQDGPGLVAYVTAGWPSPAGFPDVLAAVASAADVVEVGVPFSDPMADGVTIQQTSRQALEQGVDLDAILGWVEGCAAPVALMGYLNPFLARGPGLAADLEAAGVEALIVPDLPLEEQDILEGVRLVQLVTPVTTPERRVALCRASHGFVYAVRVTGVTGGQVDAPTDALDALRDVSTLPVCAGFGIRTAEQVRELAPHCDGVIVGTALLEAIGRGEDPAAFLRGLRPAGVG